MSAAERLKALVIEDERIGSEIGSNARKKFRSQNWPLPQIVAVVEAAETCAPILHNALGTAGMNMTPGHLLDDALAALDAALTK